MAHFPASLSMSRLAGSSDTQKVCRMTKSRNRTGEAELGEKVQRTARPPAQLQPQAQTARLKALSRMGTTVFKTQGSSEGVVAGGVFEAYLPDCRKSRFGQTLRGSSSSAGRPRHESEELFAIELDLD